MNQKHKLAKISTKDGKEFKYVDLYPITEAGIPRKVMDPEIWNIPEGYYAIETNIKSTLVFRKDYLDLGEDKLISLIESLDLDFLMSFSKPVKLYPVIENDEIPEEALDPKIWNIPEGYYAIEEIDNNESKRPEPTGRYIEKIHPDKYGLDKILAELYPIKDKDEIPEEALDPKIWNIPEGYYAICRNIIK